MPEKWTDSERQFGLALRRLFDTVFSDQETQDRSISSNAEKAEATDGQIMKAIETVNSQLSEIEDKLIFLQRQINDLAERVANLEQ
jgi:predicted DNA-binding protein YlxM (UPF0122 family)